MIEEPQGEGADKKRVNIGHGQRLMRDERLCGAASELHSMPVIEGGKTRDSEWIILNWGILLICLNAGRKSQRMI